MNQHQTLNISDTLGDSYVKEITSLNWIKNNWTNLDISDKYVWESTYRIDVVKNKEVQRSIFINLPNSIIQSPGATFVFADSLFYKKFNSYLPLVSKEYEFTSIEQGRNSLDSLRSADNVISYYARWLEYDGEFTIIVPYDTNFIDSEKSQLDLTTYFTDLFAKSLFSIGSPSELTDC